ncbi:MAG: class II aldolase/adducin family protein [Phormidesmis sp.]
MIDEGYIKYRCEWIKKAAIAPPMIAELSPYRDALHRLNLIGEYSNGIGFGNISQRLPQTAGGASLRQTGTPPPQFIVSGTRTGQLETLTAADYALVVDFDADQNRLTCEGLTQASSESLTHGVIYAHQLSVGAVIHVHDLRMWQQLINQVPTTAATIPYGTPEMAAETRRLFYESDLSRQKIFAMAGHEAGIVTFGDSLQTAYRVLIKWAAMTSIMTHPDSESALQLPYQLASPTVGYPA